MTRGNGGVEADAPSGVVDVFGEGVKIHTKRMAHFANDLDFFRG